MSAYRNRWSRIWVAFVLAVPLMIAMPADAAAPSSEWTDIAHDHPSGQADDLFDSWSDGTDVWGAGTRSITVTGVTEYRTWVQRCSGVTATCELENTRDVEGPPADTHLQSVTGTSAEDVWVAGYARARFSTIDPLLEHFDGSDWTIVPNPIHGGRLFGISAASESDVWAVGDAQGEGPLVLRWDGATWEVDPLQVRGCAVSDWLSDVSATGRHPLAVGRCINTDGKKRAMIISRRANGWHLDKITGIDPAKFYVSSVDWVGRSAWVSGYHRNRAVVLQLSHGTWAAVQVPRRASSLTGFSGTDVDDVWAVGMQRWTGLFTMHWDGSSWTRVRDPGPGRLSDVTHTSDGTAWAVGVRDVHSIIQRHDGPTSP